MVNVRIINHISNSSTQIGEVESSKPDPTDTSSETGEVAPLDKVIIRKREKKDDRKSTEGRDLGNQPHLFDYLLVNFLFSYKEAKQSHLYFGKKKESIESQFSRSSNCGCGDDGPTALSSQEKMQRKGDSAGIFELSYKYLFISVFQRRESNGKGYKHGSGPVPV